ncbi:MAG: hypothetical protein HYZ53_11745, partial [Planctomycetes bacterium]|nr:hypothetical protein [Planctomycetota bacterium]
MSFARSFPLRPLVLLTLTLPLALAAEPPAPAEPPDAPSAASRGEVTPEEARDLEKAVDGWLVDPVGKEFVRVERKVRSAWGSEGEAQAEGWLDRKDPSGRARVYFLDGDFVPAPAAPAPVPVPVDFVAVCRDAIREAEAEAEEKARSEVRARERAAKGRDADGDPEMPDLTKIMRSMRRVAAPDAGGAPLGACAAWLWRLGEKDLAARALRAAGTLPRLPPPDAPPEKQGWIHELAWTAYAGAVHAFMVAADDEALQNAARLLRLYPAYAHEFGDGAALLEELRRRKAAGALGEKGAEEAPGGFDAWPVEGRVAW